MAGIYLDIFVLAALIITACQCIEENDEVRLFGSKGTGDNEGFVEVLYHGAWRKVSNVKWDLRNDIVICKQLGYADIANKPQM